MIIEKSNFITLILIIFSIFAINDLGGSSGQYSALKYLSIAALALTMVLAQKLRKSIDRISLAGLFFFIIFTVLFTVVNDPDANSLAIIIGYLLCFSIYISASSSDGSLIRSVEKFLLIFSVFFIAINFPQIFNPLAYSIGKNQFTGILINANAFSGLCGFILIFFLCKFSEFKNLINRLWFLFLIFVSVYYLLLASSRSALIAVFLSFWFIQFGRKIKIFLAVSAALYVLFAIVNGYGDFVIGFAERDLFEDSGRWGILSLYLQEIIKNALFGVGLSEDGGRIKSELSYFDIILFSGIGSIGFIIFLLRSFYFSLSLTIKSNIHDIYWPIPIFIYIFVASAFEGYAANIASIPSVFLYISAGFVCRRYKINRANRIGELL